jgi:SAM-dependent methyltransferase
LPKERFDVVTMHRSLETLADPVTVLRRLAEWMAPGGRILISTPNLDSIWAERYGPVWSQWKPPLHLHIFSPASLRRVALHAGLRVRSFRTTSPADWLAGHEQNAPRGCAGYLAGPPPLESEQLARACEGASIASAIRWDWLGRGDCLHAVLSR